MGKFQGRVEETGNGLAQVGEYVQADGEVYEVVELIGVLHAGSNGRGDWSYAILEEAEWEDLDGEEPRCGATIEGPLQTARELFFSQGHGESEIVGRRAICSIDGEGGQFSVPAAALDEELFALVDDFGEVYERWCRDWGAEPVDRAAEAAR